MNNQHISKFLSLVLRHQPQQLGLTLDEHGWVSVKELLTKMKQAGMPIDLPKLQEVVHTNDKQRFAFSEDGSKIRASQGHSLAVELELQPVAPPAQLYHGTAGKNLASILKEGLQRRTRLFVHLSVDRETAIKVGKRHGLPLVLLVQSAAMYEKGFPFYRSANGVWLTEVVPPEFLQPEDQE